MTVHQWIPAAHAADAAGDFARSARTLFRQWGHDSDVFAIHVDDDVDDVRPWTAAESRAADVTILHFAVASAMTAEFARLPGKRAVVYHNVTPARFFAPYSTTLARMAAEGRRELQSLSGAVDLAIGVSDYNRQELSGMGFRRTDVVPFLFDAHRLRQLEAVQPLETMLQDGLANILFVGRIAPNKKIEDHLRLAEHYKRYVDASYRFIFVGRTDVVPAYYTAIRSLLAEYRMLPERFVFPGQVTDAELATYYRNAHAYVSLSEHEGFCVPIVEAMAMDVPVLAYAAGAVPETMGGAGVTFSPKDLEQAAEWLGALIYDVPLREAIIAGQRRRVQELDRSAVAPRLRRCLESVTS